MSIESHLSEIISFLAGAAGGSFLTFRFTRKSRDNIRRDSVDQKNASAGGDIVGGDKTTTHKS